MPITFDIDIKLRSWMSCKATTITSHEILNTNCNKKLESPPAWPQEAHYPRRSRPAEGTPCPVLGGIPLSYWGVSLVLSWGYPLSYLVGCPLSWTGYPLGYLFLWTDTRTQNITFTCTSYAVGNDSERDRFLFDCTCTTLKKNHKLNIDKSTHESGVAEI